MLFEGKNPLEKYDYLKKEQWEKFKMTHETAEFKVIRENAQKRQKCNEHVHYVGKAGYNGKRIEWLKDDPIARLSASESTDLSILSDDCSGRGFDWVRARVKDKGGEEGYYFPSESTKEVFKKMVAWKGKISEGSWTPHGHDDILTRALEKKEHGGYVRGVGGGVCLTDVFGSGKNSQNSGISVDDLAKRVREEYKEEMSEMQVKYNKEITEMHMKYSNEVNEMQSKLQGILDHFKKIGMPLPDNFGIELNTPPKEIIQSSCQSVDPDPPDALTNITGISGICWTTWE